MLLPPALLSPAWVCTGTCVLAAQLRCLLDCPRALPKSPVLHPQAIARIYRLGQSRATFVYRLMYAATVDEELYSRCIQKEELFM